MERVYSKYAFSCEILSFVVLKVDELVWALPAIVSQEEIYSHLDQNLLRLYRSPLVDKLKESDSYSTGDKRNR